MGFIVVAILIGLLPAFIAQSKGRSFVGWWIYGALLFIVALPHALLARPLESGLARQAVEAGNRKCPHCAEWIKTEARVCKHCGRDVPPPSGAPRLNAPVSRDEGGAWR